ncbi:hypothetical protein GCM10010441_75310 [Kitasatospora paracochleata]|uniref:hypothetical protein n=1 Tax=Kitasatospora paracochleata TaxID=58354 RepID=UPI0031CDB131
MEGLVPAAPETDRDGQADLIEAITEAVRDGDDRTIRRLLARFAELATITDLYALRDALDTARPSGDRGQRCPSAGDTPQTCPTRRSGRSCA